MRRLIAACLLLAFVVPVEAGGWNYWGRRFHAAVPSADVSNTGWTITGPATVYEAIDDGATALGFVNSDSDTTYISAFKTTSCTAVVDIANSSAYSTNAEIQYVTLTVQARRSDYDGAGAGSPSLVTNLVISAVDYSMGSATVSADSYTDYKSFTRRYTNPATGLRWTAADVDALQVKLAKTSTNRDYDLRVTGVNLIVVYDNYYTTLPAGRTHGSGN